LSLVSETFLVCLVVSDTSSHTLKINQYSVNVRAITILYN